MFFIFLVFFTEIFYFFLKNTDVYTYIILLNFLIVFLEKYIKKADYDWVDGIFFGSDPEEGGAKVNSVDIFLVLGLMAGILARN